MKKALTLQGKAGKQSMKALTAIRKTDRKVARRLQKEAKARTKELKLEAEAAQVMTKARAAQERTTKADLRTREKRSKARVLKGLARRSEHQLDAEEADFDLATTANKIRAAKASQEAAQKKTAVAQHT